MDLRAIAFVLIVLAICIALVLLVAIIWVDAGKFPVAIGAGEFGDVAEILPPQFVFVGQDDPLLEDELEKWRVLRTLMVDIAMPAKTDNKDYTETYDFDGPDMFVGIVDGDWWWLDEVVFGRNAQQLVKLAAQYVSGFSSYYLSPNTLHVINDALMNKIYPFMQYKFDLHNGVEPTITPEFQALLDKMAAAEASGPPARRDWTEDRVKSKAFIENETRAGWFPWGNNWYEFSVAFPFAICQTIHLLRNTPSSVIAVYPTTSPSYIWITDGFIQQTLNIVDSPTQSLGYTRDGQNTILMGSAWTVAMHMASREGELESIDGFNVMMTEANFDIRTDGNGLRPDGSFIFHSNVRAFGYISSSINHAAVLNVLAPNKFGDTFSMLSSIMSHPTINNNNYGLFSREYNPKRYLKPGSLGHVNQQNCGILNIKTSDYFVQSTNASSSIAIYESDQTNNTLLQNWAFNDGTMTTNHVRVCSDETMIYQPGFPRLKGDTKPWVTPSRNTTTESFVLTDSPVWLASMQPAIYNGLGTFTHPIFGQVTISISNTIIGSNIETISTEFPEQTEYPNNDETLTEKTNDYTGMSVSRVLIATNNWIWRSYITSSCGVCLKFSYANDIPGENTWDMWVGSNWPTCICHDVGVVLAKPAPGYYVFEKYILKIQTEEDDEIEEKQLVNLIKTDRSGDTGLYTEETALSTTSEAKVEQKRNIVGAPANPIYPTAYNKGGSSSIQYFINDEENVDTAYEEIQKYHRNMVFPEPYSQYPDGDPLYNVLFTTFSYDDEIKFVTIFPPAVSASTFFVDPIEGIAYVCESAQLQYSEFLYVNIKYIHWYALPVNDKTYPQDIVELENNIVIYWNPNNDRIVRFVYDMDCTDLEIPDDRDQAPKGNVPERWTGRNTPSIMATVNGESSDDGRKGAAFSHQLMNDIELYVKLDAGFNPIEMYYTNSMKDLHYLFSEHVWKCSSEWTDEPKAEKPEGIPDRADTETPAIARVLKAVAGSEPYKAALYTAFGLDREFWTSCFSGSEITPMSVRLSWLYQAAPARLYLAMLDIETRVKDSENVRAIIKVYHNSIAKKLAQANQTS